MARHLKSTIFGFFQKPKDTQFFYSGRLPWAYVRTASQQHVEIVLGVYIGDEGLHMQLTRADARMLAKRINQCLEASK